MKKMLASIRALRSTLFAPLALTAPRSISTGMSDLQSQMNAAMEEAQRADLKKREAAEGRCQGNRIARKAGRG